MKFIHISDVNLGYASDSGKSWEVKRKDEIEETFDKVLAICEEDKIDLLLIAGNLFYCVPTLEMLTALDEKLSKFSVTRTVIIAGSRDYIAKDSPAASFKFKSKTVLLPRERATNAYLKDINTCITGFSYGRAEYKDRVLENINPGKKNAINILLGHGGDAKHMPFSKSKLAKRGFDYAALGFITKPTHILKNKIAFSGCLEPISKADIGRRGYILGEADENKVEEGVKIKWKPLNMRSYINLNILLRDDITAKEIEEAIMSQINKQGYENIYRIIFKGYITHAVDVDLERICDRYNILDIVDNTFSYEEELLMYDENESNIVGRFIKDVHTTERYSEEFKKKVIHYGLEALTMAGDN